MPETMTDATSETPKRLTEQDVLNWLRAQPDFLVRNPDVLDMLNPPKEVKGKGVVDFQHYMVKRLKADRDEVVQSAREIVETTRANMSNQARIHKSVLMLLGASSFEEFIHVITMDIAPVLGVDIIAMLVESDGDVVPHIEISGVRAVPKGIIQDVMQDRTIMLRANIIGSEDVYGGGAGLVKSHALLKLSMSQNAPAILIAFGSRDPHAFVEGQGTELVTFLGGVIERCFRLWLDLPG